MEAFLVSFGLVALAELGDKTQFLALMLASRFHRPLPILAGILVAVLANHLGAAALGFFVGVKLNGPWLKWIVAASFFAVAIWAVLPEKAEDEAVPRSRYGVFGATVCAFFIAELGDKTQIATAALAARFGMLLPIVAGTTLAMLAANLPAVLLGRQLARWVSLRALRWGAVILSIALGIATLMPEG
ncbi:MAG TPA: TMEM165/GDT1 family protein [Stellaceae bacterium]|jgi:putative Ca2+/H+ antiporter (TMEM165/GDT1 family)|nr:TMEM165/GDT1 family protein [Stellaceae bacterium]